MAEPTSAGKDPPPPSTSTEQMPPPPRPSIITQAPSTSNIQQSINTAAAEESLRPTNFNPFFILIDDATTKTTSHPRKVHYIFSDDDTSHLLTEALVESSRQNSATHPDSNEERGAEAEERVIILDLNTTGDSVEKVSSLSSNWQVLSAQIEKAPTLQENEGDKGGGGLMVRVSGVGVGVFENGDGEGEQEGEEEMLGRWDGGMGVLGGVVGLEEAQREREEGRMREEQSALEGESTQEHLGRGLEVSRGDLSRGHLSRVEVEKGKGKEKEMERRGSLYEEEIGEG